MQRIQLIYAKIICDDGTFEVKDQEIYVRWCVYSVFSLHSIFTCNCEYYLQANGYSIEWSTLYEEVDFTLTKWGKIVSKDSDMVAQNLLMALQFTLKAQFQTWCLRLFCKYIIIVGF